MVSGLWIVLIVTAFSWLMIVNCEKCVESSRMTGYLECQSLADIDQIPEKTAVISLSLISQKEEIICDKPILSSLPNLQTFTVVNGSFIKVELNCFSGLNDLRDIRIITNSLKVFDLASINPEKIERLWLDDNALSQINFIDTTYPQLTSISMSVNNLSNIVITSKSLPNLRILSLEYNHFESFDIEGENLYSLRINNNNIKSLDDINLKAEKLLMLYLSDNKLTSISTGFFSNLSRIEIAHFENNPINNINLSSFQIDSIKLFDDFIELWRDSKLEPITIYVGLSRVRQLDLTFNGIDRFNVFNLTEELRLEELNISRNNIDSIGPKDLEYLPDLISLDLSNNKIATIAPGAFDHCKKLHTILLKRNVLQTIPDNFLNTLISIVFIDLSDNQLKKFPIPGKEWKTYHPLFNIRGINLKNNSLSCDAKQKIDKWMSVYWSFKFNLDELCKGS